MGSWPSKWEISNMTTDAGPAEGNGVDVLAVILVVGRAVFKPGIESYLSGMAAGDWRDSRDCE